MPEKIDPALRDWTIRLVGERRIGLGRESVRRWALQADIDDGTRHGMTSAEHAEIKRLRAGDALLRRNVVVLRAATSGAADGLVDWVI